VKIALRGRAIHVLKAFREDKDFKKTAPPEPPKKKAAAGGE
jgi:hypothetical protein